MKLHNYDVIVLGGGAAGLMAAFTAAKRDLSVLVIEKSNMVGKKILMSGGGHCNFTNGFVDYDDFISENVNFCRSAFSKYGPNDFMDLVNKHKIPYVVRRNNQFFCEGSSRDILNMLLKECDSAGVEIMTNVHIETIKHESLDNQEGFVWLEDGGSKFTLRGGINDRIARAELSFVSTSLIIATGALSIPTLGGSGFGYEVARNFSIEVTNTKPGLVPFTLGGEDKFFSSELSGVSIPVLIKVGSVEFKDDMLFTHKGVSGPSVLQASSYWEHGTTVRIDLLPDFDFLEALYFEKTQGNKKLLRTYLSTMLPRSLVAILEVILWDSHSEVPIKQMPNQLIENISSYIKSWTLIPTGTEGYRTAEVTVGGVSTRQLDSRTMEYKNCPGLYFIGEVVDVTGHLGGYNFQWAWSSGFTAGSAVG